jgi:hypothetical protein
MLLCRLAGGTCRRETSIAPDTYINCFSYPYPDRNSFALSQLHAHPLADFHANPDHPFGDSYTIADPLYDAHCNANRDPHHACLPPADCASATFADFYRNPLSHGDEHA